MDFIASAYCFLRRSCSLYIYDPSRCVLGTAIIIFLTLVLPFFVAPSNYQFHSAKSVSIQEAHWWWGSLSFLAKEIRIPLRVATAQQFIENPFNCEGQSYQINVPHVFYDDVTLGENCEIEGISGPKAKSFTTDFFLIQSGLGGGELGARNVVFSGATLKNVQVYFNSEMAGKESFQTPFLFAVFNCHLIVADRSWTVLFAFMSTKLPPRSEILILNNLVEVSAVGSTAPTVSVFDFSIFYFTNSTVLEIAENYFFIEVSNNGSITTSQFASAVSFFFGAPTSATDYLTFDGTHHFNISGNYLSIQSLAEPSQLLEMVPAGSLIVFSKQEVLLEKHADLLISGNEMVVENEGSVKFVSSWYVECYILASVTFRDESQLVMRSFKSSSVNNCGSNVLRVESGLLKMTGASRIVLERARVEATISSTFSHYGGPLGTPLSKSFDDCQVAVLSIWELNVSIGDRSKVLAQDNQLRFDTSQMNDIAHMGTTAAVFVFKGDIVFGYTEFFNVSDGASVVAARNVIVSEGYSKGLVSSLSFARCSLVVSFTNVYVERGAAILSTQNRIVVNSVRPNNQPMGGTPVFVASFHIRYISALTNTRFLVSGGSQLVSKEDDLRFRIVGTKEAIATVFALTYVRISIEGLGSGIFVESASLDFFGSPTLSNGPFDAHRPLSSSVVEMISISRCETAVRDSATITVANNRMSVVSDIADGAGASVLNVQYGELFAFEEGNASLIVRNNTLKTFVGGPVVGDKFSESGLVYFIAPNVFAVKSNSWILIEENTVQVRRQSSPSKNDDAQTPMNINMFSLYDQPDVSMIVPSVATIEGRSRRRGRGQGYPSTFPISHFERPRFAEDDGVSSIIVRNNTIDANDAGIKMRHESGITLVARIREIQYAPAVEVAFSDPDELRLISSGALLPLSGNVSASGPLPPYSLPAYPSSLAPLRIDRNIFLSSPASGSIPLPLILFVGLPKFVQIPRSGGNSSILSGGLVGSVGVVADPTTSYFFASQCGNQHNLLFNGVVLASADAPGAARRVGKGVGCLDSTASASVTATMSLNPTKTKTLDLSHSASISVSRSLSHTLPSTVSLSLPASATETASSSASSSLTSTQTVSSTHSESLTVSASLQRGCPSHCSNLSLTSVKMKAPPATAYPSSGSNPTEVTAAPCRLTPNTQHIAFGEWYFATESEARGVSSHATTASTSTPPPSVLTSSGGSDPRPKEGGTEADNSTTTTTSIPQESSVLQIGNLNAYARLRMRWSASVAPVAIMVGSSASNGGGVLVTNTSSVPSPTADYPLGTYVSSADEENSGGGSSSRALRYRFGLIDHTMAPGEISLVFHIVYANEEARHLARPLVSAVLVFTCFESPPVPVFASLGPPPPPVPVLDDEVLSTAVAVALANAANAADMQTLAILGLSACAKGSAKTSGLALRSIAPLAISESCEGGVAGNFILVCAVLLLHGTAAIVVKLRSRIASSTPLQPEKNDINLDNKGEERSKSDQEEQDSLFNVNTSFSSPAAGVTGEMGWFAACDRVQFPSISLSVILFAQNGFFLCGFELIRGGTTVGQVVLGVLAVLWTFVPIAAFVVIAYRFASRAFMPLVYRLSGWRKVVVTLMLPNGQLDTTVRGTAMFSTVVAKYQRPEPYLVLLTFGSFFASMPLTVGSGDGCEVAYIASVVLHVLFAVLLVITRPFRIFLLNVLQPVALVLSAIVIAHYTVVLRSPYDVPAPLAASLNVFATLQTVVNALKTVQVVFAKAYTMASLQFPSLQPFVASHAWAVAARPRQRKELGSARKAKETCDEFEVPSPKEFDGPNSEWAESASFVGLEVPRPAKRGVGALLALPPPIVRYDAKREASEFDSFFELATLNINSPSEGTSTFLDCDRDFGPDGHRIVPVEPRTPRRSSRGKTLPEANEKRKRKRKSRSANATIERANRSSHMSFVPQLSFQPLLPDFDFDEDEDPDAFLEFVPLSEIPQYTPPPMVFTANERKSFFPNQAINHKK